MKLTFFRAARTVLWFRLVTKAMLVTHWCSSYCWTVFAEHAASVSQSAPLWVIGSVQEVGRGHNQADDPNQPKKYSVLNNVMLSNKTVRKGVRWVNYLLRRNWLGIGLPMRCGESDCLCITCFVFFHSSSTSHSLIKQFLSQLTHFLAFTLLFFFPHPTGHGEGKGASGWVVPTGVNPQHCSMSK